jgi:hypothetical protein
MALSAPNSPPSVRGDASSGGLSSSKDKEKKSLLRLTGRRKKDKERVRHLPRLHPQPAILIVRVLCVCVWRVCVVCRVVRAECFG